MTDKPKYYNEVRNKASQRYNSAHLEQVNFRVRKGEKAVLQAEASARGMSMSQYLVNAVNAYAGKQVLTPPNIASNTDEPAPDDDNGNAVEVVPDANAAPAEDESVSEDSENNTVISSDGNADLSNAPDSTTAQTELTVSTNDGHSEPASEDAGKRGGRKRGKLLAKAARQTRTA